MATKKVMKQLLSNLTTLQKKVKENGEYNSMLGICSNSGINRDISQVMVFQDICNKWKHFSGDSAYPVHTNNRKSPDWQYFDTKNMWTGKYGKRRKELLLFVINKLKRQLKTKPRRKK